MDCRRRRGLQDEGRVEKSGFSQFLFYCESIVPKNLPRKVNVKSKSNSELHFNRPLALKLRSLRLWTTAALLTSSIMQLEIPNSFCAHARIQLSISLFLKQINSSRK